MEKVIRPGVVYTMLSLAVLLPMLLPGYILTLDMAFTPTLRMPQHISSSYLFNAALHYLNVIIPSQIIQKVMLFLILLLCGLGMHLLVRHIQSSKNSTPPLAIGGAYLAGALYMINPFTYSRFMAGQYAVLLGYALVPFFARALLRFFAVPTPERMAILTGLGILISIVSVHTLGLLAILLVVTLGVQAWRCRTNGTITKNCLVLCGIGVGIFILVSGYWLIPAITGTSSQGQALRQFSTNDRQAFATVGDGAIDKLGDVLQLQGFWAEGQGLYLLPQDQLQGWLLAVVGLWVLVVAGAVWLWRRQRATTAIFVGTGIIATTLAITGLPDWSVLAGFREPQKFIGLLALTYALLAGLGASALLAKTKGIGRSALAVPIIVLPVLLTPVMYWGFDGQLSPRQYPADWFAINQQLNQDQTDFRVLSLPWHLYMHYPFAGRVIVNPSEAFFDKPTIASNELEFMGASPTYPDGVKTMLTHDILPAAKHRTMLGKQLQPLDIKYIVLAKTYDYKTYDYLDKQADLSLIAETPNLKLYRNLAYE